MLLRLGRIQIICAFMCAIGGVGGLRGQQADNTAIAGQVNPLHADRKLLQTHSTREGYSQWEPETLEIQPSKGRRGLAQADPFSASGVAPAPAPTPSAAPGPQTESVWPSPPISPFLPPSNDSNLACCCRCERQFIQCMY